MAALGAKEGVVATGSSRLPASCTRVGFLCCSRLLIMTVLLFSPIRPGLHRFGFDRAVDETNTLSMIVGEEVNLEVSPPISASLCYCRFYEYCIISVVVFFSPMWRIMSTLLLLMLLGFLRTEPSRIFRSIHILRPAKGYGSLWVLPVVIEKTIQNVRAATVPLKSLD